MSTETLGVHGSGHVGGSSRGDDEDPEDALFAIADAISRLADAVAEIARHVAMQRMEARKEKDDG